MRKVAGGVFCAIYLYLMLQPAGAASLIPGGQVIGLELEDGSVSVAAFDDRCGDAARAAGLMVGDEILTVDGARVTCAEDVRAALQRSDGSVEVEVQRSGGACSLTVRPRVTSQGPRLGVRLRQGVTGIGTVTWYDPQSHRFGALGHGVNDRDGKLAAMTGGTAYRATVLSVKQGERGQPGQLRGGMDDGCPLGPLEKNTAKGIFGTVDTGWMGQPLETAAPSEVRTGPAKIRSTVSGETVREYDVQILKLYPRSSPEGRDLLLKVTDPQLLSATGGIVQGMSGSPIIQDGKLVGAVTHVLVNDPTRGYGIFIENMLDAAG
ncbi:MAG: SpoIVB peptidase [Oscillospiraceae bacterium]|nr:SpoIVB peptidase [Oscillospiraceae bacterium]